MSEGPEVRRTADRLEAALRGLPIEAVEYRRKSGGLDPDVLGRLIGSRLERVRTFGKHLVIDFSEGVYLRNHMMMFGKWRIYSRADYESGAAHPPPRMRRQRPVPAGVRVGATVSDVRRDSRVRLVLVTAKTVAIEFNGPVLSFTRADPARLPTILRLGPDGLERPFRAAEARRRLGERAHMKLADLLLDQTFVAGIGNKYKSEILFKLGFDPFVRADLSPRETTALFKEIPHTLQEGYMLGGRTRPLEAGESAASWNHKHFVFRRGGRPCWTCGAVIATDRANSARVTYRCPKCQPARAAKRAGRTR